MKRNIKEYSELKQSPNLQNVNRKDEKKDTIQSTLLDIKGILQML